jgi:glutaconate CoA-transferase subunit A
MPGEYFSDEAHLRTWLTVEKDLESFRRFLDEYVFGVPDFDAYLTKCGGLRRLQELRAQEFMLSPAKP